MTRPRSKAVKKIRDRSFSRRLEKACDSHSLVPAFGQGRQTWIRDQLGVSAEAVRKWFAAESRPRPDLMRRLAKLLEVDEAWLALGITPDVAPKERRARDAEADGAVNVVAGLIQMNGAHPAFPSPDDPRSSYVDLYAIIRGAQFAIHVSLAQAVSQGVLVFRVPAEHEDCTVIGMYHAAPLGFQLLHMTPSLIAKHKVRRGGYYEITVNKIGRNFHSGEDKWPRIQSFDERL